MTQANEKVLERVKKLIALGTNAGATENESQIAMRRAHSLMAKHNIDMAQLSDKPAERATSESIHPGYRWARDITTIVAYLYMCRIVFHPSRQRNKYRFTFVGEAVNTAIAADISKFIVMSLKREAARGRRIHGTAWQTSFLHGAAQRITDRCWQLIAEAKRGEVDEVSTSKALVLASLYDQEDRLNQEYIDTLETTKTVARNIRINSSEGYYAGWEAGDRIQIQREMK